MIIKCVSFCALPRLLDLQKILDGELMIINFIS